MFTLIRIQYTFTILTIHIFTFTCLHMQIFICTYLHMHLHVLYTNLYTYMFTHANITLTHLHVWSAVKSQFSFMYIHVCLNVSNLLQTLKHADFRPSSFSLLLTMHLPHMAIIGFLTGQKPLGGSWLVWWLLQYLLWCSINGARRMKFLHHSRNCVICLLRQGLGGRIWSNIDNS